MEQFIREKLDSIHHHSTTTLSKERSGNTQHVPGFGLCVPARGYNGLRAAFLPSLALIRGLDLHGRLFGPSLMAMLGARAPTGSVKDPRSWPALQKPSLAGPCLPQRTGACKRFLRASYKACSLLPLTLKRFLLTGAGCQVSVVTSSPARTVALTFRHAMAERTAYCGASIVPPRAAHVHQCSCQGLSPCLCSGVPYWAEAN